MTEKVEKDFDNNNICLFCEKNIESDKTRDHCHLTGEYRGPAQIKCNNNITQKHSNCIPITFHNFSVYDCNLFFKELVDRKKEKVKFGIITKTNEQHISFAYGCVRFIDGYRLLSSSLDSLVKTLDSDDFVVMKKEFPEKWQYLKKILLSFWILS